MAGALLTESGITFVTENVEGFERDLGSANDAVAGFGSAAQSASGPLDAFGEIATGALRRVGEVAINALGAAAGAVTQFFGNAFQGALEDEQTMARFDAVLKATEASAKSQSDAYTAAAGQNITATRLSGEEIVKLQDKYEHAAAKLEGMEASYLKLKEPTASQTLALQDQREAVAGLSGEISSGSASFTTTLADRMGLVPPVVRLTRDELLGLADQYKNLVGGSADTVIAAESVLLKFDTIGKDTFPTALEAAADLAAFLGVDVTSAAQTLGFALDNPGEALGRLNKQTGAFPKAEQEAIKAMMEAGDAAGAQARILELLNGAIGGTAESLAATTGGQWEIFTTSVAEAGETIAAVFLPVLNDLFKNVLAPAIPVITDLATAFAGFVSLITQGEFAAAIDALGEFGPVRDILQGLGIDIYSLEAPFTAFMEMFSNVGTQIGIAFGPLQDALANLFTVVFGQLPPAQTVIETVMAAISNAVLLAGQFISNTLIPALTTAVEWITLNWPLIQLKIQEGWIAVQPVLQAIGDFIVGTVIPAFQQAVTWVITNWPTIQLKIQEAWVAIQPVLQAIGDFITTTLIPAFQSAVDWVTEHWPAIQATIGEVITFAVMKFTEIKAWVDENWPLIQQTIETIVTGISDTIHGIIDPLVAFWTENHDTIMAVASTIWELIKTNIDTAIHTIEGIIKTVMLIINGDWDGAWNTIKTTLETIWEGMKTSIDLTIHAASVIIQDVVNTLKTWWDTKWTEIKTSVTDKIEAIRAAINDKINAAKTIFETAMTSISTALTPVRTAIDNFLGSIEGLWNWISSHVFNFSINLPSLPDWAIPGSPTPFEIGLRGITGALEKLNRVPKPDIFGRGGPGMGPTVGMGGGPTMGGGLAFGGGPNISPVSAPAFTGGPMIAPPRMDYTPRPTGGPVNGGGKCVTINIDARGASPSETRKSVEGALKRVGGYADTRLRLRGAM